MTRVKKNKSAKTPIIGFLGAGKMGGAILTSLIKAKRTRASAIRVCDAVPARLEQLAADYGVKPSTIADVVSTSDVVFLAVKPQDLGALLENIPAGSALKPLFISIAAGKRIEWLEARMPGARIIRSMPNLAVSVGLGMTAFCGGTKVKKADLQLAAKLLGSTGKAIELPEEQLDAVTALSGSGPAFLSYVVQAMIDGGVAIGLSAETAAELALQTMLGTATVLSNGSIGVADFIKSVTSAKGTTAEGLAVLEKSAVLETLKLTLAAAARRSRELSQLP